jgi:hypothetical protein
MLSRRNFAVALVCAVGVAALIVPAAFGGGSGAQKAPLVPNVFEFCSGGLINPPSPLPTDTGFVVLTAENGVVSAEVSLKNATPNTTYGVELVQTPSGTGCNDYSVASLTTNEQGNGNVHVSAPQVPGDNDAFVGLFYGNLSDFYNSPDVVLG